MSLVPRIQNILLSPPTEWPVIAAEGATVNSLYTGYIIPLSAIPPAAVFVLQFLLYPSGIIHELVAAVLDYGLGLIAIYAVAYTAAKLAPSFGGRDDLIQGLKLIAYAYTAVWLAGVFLVIPVLGGLVVLVALIYSFYLIYLGTAPMLAVAQDKSIIYTLIIALVTAALTYLIFAVARAIA